MGFSSKQVAALRRNVDTRHIRVRQSNGRELSYLEGWYVRPNHRGLGIGRRAQNPFSIYSDNANLFVQHVDSQIIN